MPDTNGTAIDRATLVRLLTEDAEVRTAVIALVAASVDHGLLRVKIQNAERRHG